MGNHANWLKSIHFHEIDSLKPFYGLVNTPRELYVNTPREFYGVFIIQITADWATLCLELIIWAKLQLKEQWERLQTTLNVLTPWYLIEQNQFEGLRGFWSLKLKQSSLLRSIEAFYAFLGVIKAVTPYNSINTPRKPCKFAEIYSVLWDTLIKIVLWPCKPL